MNFWLAFTGLFLLGLVVIWLLFSSAAKLSKRIRDRDKDGK